MDKLKKEIKVQLEIIPDGSFIIFKTDHPDELVDCFSVNPVLMNQWKAKKLEGGLILRLNDQVQVLSDEALASAGLQRIPKPKGSES